ncbi:MAG: hypothetical protein JWQ43_2321 [Glaciihabitans sp.]|nr:hypothetical protein [Glaciihabitans sp.]
MSGSRTDQVRTGGLACVTAALVGVAVALVNQVTPATVPETATSFPLSPAAYVWFELLLVLFRIGVFAGVVALAASGVAGRSRLARIGIALALVGLLLGILVELGAVFSANSLSTDGYPTFLRATAIVAAVLVAVGLVLAGFSVIYSGAWGGWHQYTPMLVGGVTVIAILLTLGDGNRSWGLGLYSVAFGVLGFALVTKPVSVTPRARQSVR